jgi:hypothetical protein
MRQFNERKTLIISENCRFPLFSVQILHRRHQIYSTSVLISYYEFKIFMGVTKALAPFIVFVLQISATLRGCFWFRLQVEVKRGKVSVLAMSERANPIPCTPRCSRNWKQILKL